MTRLISQLSVSLDGFVAGPDQDHDNPLGRGGMRLHEWAFADPMPPEDRRAREAMSQGMGAYVMGRNMFGPIRGPWDGDWRGWGPNPPYHHDVFVLTHHARESLPMEGGTTFHFVTEGIEHAVALARESAGEQDVFIAGGASTVRQALAAGLLDELRLDLVPIVLGAGERLLDGLDDIRFRLLDAVHGPAVTHLRYAVERG
jgi:dihydrofolate reductase